MNDNYNTPNSSCCGRPMNYAPKSGCNYKDECETEYPCSRLACIKERQPDCKAKAVIPSITVDSVEGITDLANCLVHVNDINTTFYIDDKHRIMITWAGPVNIPGYDMETNPERFRDQIITDTEAGLAVIYDAKGVGYTFGIEQGLDVTEAVNNKIDEMAEDGSLAEIIMQYIGGNITWTFDTVADMKLDTNLINGSYARTLGFHTINDGGGALYHITDSGTANGMDVIAVDDLYANLIGSTNVKQFGAYGDGTHNDTLPIQRSIDVNNELLLSDGTYLVSQITIDTDSAIIDGHGATIKSIDNNSETAIILVQNNGVNKVVIKDVNIDGNKDNNSGTIDGIKLTRTVYSDCFGRLENVTISNCSGNGISVQASANTLIREMKFINIHSHHNDGNGLFSNTMTDSFISLSVFDNNKLNGIYISNSGSIKISQVKCYWNGINSTEELDVDRLDSDEMVITSDATPQSGKTYYTRSGAGVWQDSYKYTKFTGSSFDGGTDYYEVSSANYLSRSHGIYVKTSSVILIVDSEMQCNAGDGIHCEGSYNIDITNTSLDNNGYYFDSDYQAHSYSSLGIQPFYAGLFCGDCSYINMEGTTLNAFYNYTGVSQAYGVTLKSCLKSNINIASRLQTNHTQLLSINPEDVYVKVNGSLPMIEMDLDYNITDLLTGYTIDPSSNMHLVGNKVVFQIYVENSSGVDANQDKNIFTFNTHLRPKYRQIIESAFLSQYYTNYNNASVSLAVIVESTGVFAFRTATSGMKYINITDEITLVQR